LPETTVRRRAGDGGAHAVQAAGVHLAVVGTVRTPAVGDRYVAAGVLLRERDERQVLRIRARRQLMLPSALTGIPTSLERDQHAVRDIPVAVGNHQSTDQEPANGHTTPAAPEPDR